MSDRNRQDGIISFGQMIKLVISKRVCRAIEDVPCGSTPGVPAPITKEHMRRHPFVSAVDHSAGDGVRERRNRNKIEIDAARVVRKNQFVGVERAMLVVVEFWNVAELE